MGNGKCHRRILLFQMKPSKNAIAVHENVEEMSSTLLEHDSTSYKAQSTTLAKVPKTLAHVRICHECCFVQVFLLARVTCFIDKGEPETETYVA